MCFHAFVHSHALMCIFVPFQACVLNADASVNAQLSSTLSIRQPLTKVQVKRPCSRTEDE